MKKYISAFLICGLLIASFASCAPPESLPSKVEDPIITEQATEAITETVSKSAEEATEQVTVPAYFGQLVYPDTMTDKEKANTAYRGDTILDADKAYEIGEYHLPVPLASSAKIKKMMDSIREMKMYDEQTDTNYMVNIVLPPDYDENREYPVFLITDSQYWFSNLPNVWKLISKGQAAPVIFVTLRIDYDLNGYDDKLRYDRFVIQQEELLDFITNDLMQLVSLNYKTDASRSVFFGHSLGGLFAHYALCNSDKYEYQPFAKYIIASPAMWSYYYTGEENFDTSGNPDPYAYRDDFGYFNRNESMDKDVFICAGAEEHYNFDAPDLATIPQDAQTIYERFTSHGVNAEIKLYEGMMHMSYVEDMLKEYLKQTFPPETSDVKEKADGLICPDTMTEKEKSGTYYRELTLLDPDKAYEIGEDRIKYGLPTDSSEWAKMKKIENDIREMRIYDEQLDTNFLVHIILPPDYDENEEYPVFFMTDSSSWINKLPNIRKLITKGEAAPVIFVTIFNDYDTAGDFVKERAEKFIVYQDKMLDFITNDVMQLISLNYKVDPSESVLFGHSWGGIFSHYALCNSDKYEYQPFKNYIIGSSCLSMLDNHEYWENNIPVDYDDETIARCAECMHDFGYFDRNETMDKNVFICAGSEEIGGESWTNGMSMTDNVTALYDRLTAHGVNAELKIYEGRNHVNYVEDMLKEYLKQTFPTKA